MYLGVTTTVEQGLVGRHVRVTGSPRRTHDGVRPAVPRCVDAPPSRRGAHGVVAGGVRRGRNLAAHRAATSAARHERPHQSRPRDRVRDRRSGHRDLGIEPDFVQINAVLAGLVQSVQSRLNRVSPLYRFVDDVGGDDRSSVVNFSIARARAEAWRFALALASMDGSAATAGIEAQDRGGEPTRRTGAPTRAGCVDRPARRPADREATSGRHHRRCSPKPRRRT